MPRRVVVTGIGMICAVGNNVPDAWQALLAGKSGVERITSFDASQFACQIAAEVKNFDPLQYHRQEGSAQDGALYSCSDRSRR